MKKNKKKLPRYWLGTMRPTSTGYQQARGLGDTTFTSQAGIPIQEGQDLLSTSLQKLPTAAHFPVMALQNTKTVPAFTAIAASQANQAAANFGSSVLQSGGSGVSSLSNTIGNINKLGLENKLTGGLQQTGSKTVLNNIGKGAAILGTGYGLYNVGNDIYHMNDTVSQSDIANTATTNTYTTSGGNTYTEKSGIDSSGVISLENQMAKQKKVGLMIDLMGLGASAGSFFPGLGTLFGAGAGAVLGAIASAAGFGNNEDEVKEKIKNQQDVFALQNWQSIATAKDKDVKQAFARRGAVDGKRPGGKPVAMVASGEAAGVLNPDGSTQYLVRVPGKNSNKDNVVARENTLVGEAAENPRGFILTRKKDKDLKSVTGFDSPADLALATGNVQESLMWQDKMQKDNMKSKNNKLPKYWDGSTWSRILATLPHFSSFNTNWGQYNRAKNASTYAPDTDADNAEGRAAVNELANLRFDERPYLAGADRAFRQANWDTRRNVGLGIGGRAIAMNSAYRQYLDSLAGVNAQKNDADAKYTQIYTNALQALGAANQQARINSNINKFQWQQQANAAKENWMAQYLKNMDTSILNGVAEWLRQGQYEDALSAQNRMLRLYENQNATDEMKAKSYINSLGNNAQNTSVWTPPLWLRQRYVPTKLMNINDYNWTIRP